MGKTYWLLKTEPETYNFNQLVTDKKTNWNGVRNFQARNNLRQMKQNDLALIYHSGKEKSVIGIAKVIKAHYPDLDTEHPGDWVQVDLAPVGRLGRAISLAEIKGSPPLKDLPLIKQSRLSVMPITQKHYEMLVHLGDSA